ncbi:MAG: dipeptidase [Alphaproteobacteria bacterium]|nr:dipeptidase [Alphaproteobacteria bacterium]
MSDPVIERLQADRLGVLSRLGALLAARSVSTDPAYADGMAEARAILLDRLATAGFANVGLLEAGGHPAVYGEWLGAPGRPTILVYGHYDVQPPDPAELWKSPPFEATVRDGRLYARGASDDKGPSSIAIETVAAFLATEGGLPVNVKILLEGEEEIGSATLGDILETNRRRLAADAVLSADGGRWRADMPSIAVGSRGIAALDFTVTTAVKDLHSGRYGGVVPNALHVAARLIAGLHHPDGRPAVAGFLDGVVEPSESEKRSLAAIPFDDAGYYTDLVTAPAGEPGYATLERLWYRPTIDANGLWGGYTGAGGKTVIPNTAHAKLSMRLVPGQDPAAVTAATVRHLREHCPPGATLSIREGHPSAAYLVPDAHPLLLAAEAALQDTTGQVPLRVRNGATLPLSDIVRSRLGIDTVMFSFSTADEDFHAPNEFIRLSAFEDGFAAWVSILRRLGTLTPQEFEAFRR